MKQLQKEGVKLITSGVDWVTVVCTEQHYNEVKLCIDYLTKLMQNLGHVKRPFYTSIMSGQKIGALRYGRLNKNETKTMVMMSGSYSPVLCHWVNKEVRTTRIDFCVDIHLEKKTEGLGDYYNRFHKGYQKKHQGRRVSQFYDGVMDSFTLYVGSGGSGNKLRVYDKGGQLYGRSGQWLRYELQVGRDRATDARRLLLSSENPTQHTINRVNEFCKKCGLYFPDYAVRGERVVAMSRIDNGNTERERGLTFIRSVVKPFLSRFRTLESDSFILSELGFERLSSIIEKNQ